MQRGDRAFVQPFVSIVTITKDNPSELDRTIESVAAQTFRNYEHIIVDGSAAPMLLEKCARVVRCPARGIANAFNRGMQEATGQFIIFLNAGDTFVAANTLDRAAAQIAKVANSRASVFFGDWYAWQKQKSKLIRASAGNLWRTNTLCHQAVLFPLGLHKKHLYDERLISGMDYDVYLRMASDAEFHYLGLPVANFFYGGISSSRMPAIQCIATRLMIRGMNHPRGAGSISGLPQALMRELVREAKRFVRGLVYRSDALCNLKGWRS